MSNRQNFGYLEEFLWVGIVAIAIFAIDEQAKGNDIKLYYSTASNLVRGLVPYRDFALEYPPLAILPMLLPQLINPFGFDVYRVLFPLENFLFCVLGWLIIKQILPSWNWGQTEKPQLILKYYILISWILVPVILWRYDLFPALLTLVGFLLVTRKRPFWAGICFGLGITAKLYPVVTLPIFSAYYLVKREYSALIRLWIATSVICCLVILPFAFLASDRFFSFLEYHELRGIQIETFVAGLILLATQLGLTKVKIDANFGAFHLNSSLANSILQSSFLSFFFLISFAVLIFICINYFRKDRIVNGTISDRSLLIYLIAALIVFILSGKVFSTQYLIWLLPFVLLLEEQEQKLFMLISILSIAIYPFTYLKLVKIYLLPIILLNLRNFFMLALLFRLIAKYPISAKTDLAKRKSNILSRLH
jgi:uncharacterized membrane protein